MDTYTTCGDSFRYWVDQGTTASTASSWTAWTDTYATATVTVSGSADYTWDCWTSGTYGATISVGAADTNKYVFGHWVEEKREEKAKNKKENKAKLRKERVEAKREEELRLRTEMRLEEERQLQEERSKAHKAAEKKAHKLLTDNLTKEQLDCLNKNGYFRVKAQSGKHYDINKNPNYNVISLDRFRKKKKQHCALPEKNVPHYDTMLAQKLMLEHKEKEFLKIANVR